MSETKRTELLTVRPFSCGTQYADWTGANCERGCKKAADPADPPPRCACDIEQALIEAHCGGGTVSAEIARRMGRERWKGHYNWPCPEHDPPWAESEGERP